MAYYIHYLGQELSCGGGILIHKNMFDSGVYFTGDGRETQLCLRRADDSSGSRTPVLCDVNDEEAHHSDDAIESVSGEEQSLNDNGTCDIKVLDSYKEGTNSNGHGGAANFDTERTSDFDSGEKTDTISFNIIGHESDNGKAHGLLVGYIKRLVLSDTEQPVSYAESGGKKNLL